MKDKKKENDEPKPGPSGLQSKKTENKKEEKLKPKTNFFKDFKRPKKIPSVIESRRSSSEKTPRRYSLPTHTSLGPQKSHSVRNIVPKTKEKLKKRKTDLLKRKSTKDSTTSFSRDHNEAVDWYFRSTGFMH